MGVHDGWPAYLVQDGMVIIDPDTDDSCRVIGRPRPLGDRVAIDTESGCIVLTRTTEVNISPERDTGP